MIYSLPGLRYFYYLVFLFQYVVSWLLILYLNSIIPKSGLVLQQTDLWIYTYYFALLGLIIAIFFIGTSIIMIRYINTTLTYKSSWKRICFVGFGLIIIGVIAEYFNFFNPAGVSLFFIGLVALFSLSIDYIGTKYKLIF